MAATVITLEVIEQVVTYIKAILSDGFIPKIGIIGGSGLSGLDEALQGERHEISYVEINKAVKQFPVTTGMYCFLSIVLKG